MNMMEMVLALLAVVFFTSVAANYNRHLMDQNEYVIAATLHVQATQLCHSVLDEVDAKLFSNSIAYDEIIEKYHGKTREIDLQFPGDKYNISIEAVLCDSLGNDEYAADDPLAKNRLVKVEASTPGLRFPAKMQRIYAKIHYFK